MRRIAPLALLLVALCACDRNLGEYDPHEEPVEPDLTRIFPEGAERAARVEPALPAPPGRAAPALAAEESPATAGPPVRGTVRIAEGLDASVPPGAVLFIVARGAAGGPPVAVERVADPRLPLEFELGPEDRMIQAMPFTGPFRLSARVDADGDAASRSPGDLQGELDAPVPAGASGVDLVLDEVVTP